MTPVPAPSNEVRFPNLSSLLHYRFADLPADLRAGLSVAAVALPVGVAYSADPQQVKVALLEACQKNQEILTAPAPQVFFMGFGDSALNFELLVWIAQPSRQLVIKSDLYFVIEASLRHYDIEVPFPQRDLHIRSGHLPTSRISEAQSQNQAADLSAYESDEI